MSLRGKAALLAVLALAAGTASVRIRAQETNSEVTRRVKTKVQPLYPELARRLNLTGSVKVLLVIAPNGTVKDAKILGGHPLLANAALEAARKWRFEVSAEESNSTVEFKFEPRQ